ncbi:MAG: IS66 family transposase [Bacilli bacterium]
MINKELELFQENEKQKNEIKTLKNKIKDLETEKKTFKNKLKIQKEDFEDWKKENKSSIQEKNSLLKKIKELKRKHMLYVEDAMSKKRKLEDEKENLEITIKNLTHRINKNSSNSSIPSSTERIYTKKKCVNTSRVKTQRTTGGQFGHKGTGLTKEKAKELIQSKKVKHEIKKHVLLGASIDTSKCIVKYELEIETITKVIEHRFYVKENSNEIPEEYNTDVIYGNNLKTFATMMLNEGFISLNRTKRIIDEMSNNTIKLSEGSLVNFNKELARNSNRSIEKIKDALIKAKVLHVDESGVRVNGDLKWIHTAVTEGYTLYQIEDKRGKKGIDNLGILKYFIGVLIHDHFVSYYKYITMTHAECNAHILRYLKQVIEIFQRKGAEKFLEYLIKINNEKKALQIKGVNEFSKEKIEEIYTKYSEILSEWELEYEKYVKGKKKTQSLIAEGNLFKRLKKYKKEHLLFIKDFEVPFSNNQAEKALRLIKTKMKVSGCFRGKDKGSNFAIIRSLLETSKKNGINLFKTVNKTFKKEELDFIKA